MVLVDAATIVVTHVFRRRRFVVSKMTVLVLNECGLMAELFCLVKEN